MRVCVRTGHQRTLRWGLFHAGLASLVQVVPQSAVEASSLKIDANHYHREASNRIDYSEKQQRVFGIVN